MTLGSSRCLGLCDHWKNIDEDHLDPTETPGKGAFELVLMQTNPLQSIPTNNPSTISYPNASIQTLTPGRYTIFGRSIDADGYEYANLLIIHLHSNFHLKGICNDSVYEQTIIVSSRWNRSGFEYEQCYIVDNIAGAYRYEIKLRPRSHGLAFFGTWKNVLWEDDLLDSEHGTYDCIIACAVVFITALSV